MASTTPLNHRATLAVLKYTAALGSIPGRPDLPAFSFRMFEVIIRKHHKGFWTLFKPDEPTHSIEVHLSYHPNIGNIRRKLGGLTQLIQIEKVDSSITPEEASLSDLLFSALNPQDLAAPAVSISSPTVSAPPSMPLLASTSAPTVASLLASPVPSTSSALPSHAISLPEKRSKKRGAPSEKLNKKKKPKTVEFNGDLENLLALEEIVNTLGLDGDFHL